jgi:hypothetical protein
VHAPLKASDKGASTSKADPGNSYKENPFDDCDADKGKRRPHQKLSVSGGFLDKELEDVMGEAGSHAPAEEL